MPEWSEQTQQRLRNLEALKEAGYEAYPYRYPKTHDAAQILEAHAGAGPGEEWPEVVRLAGRLVALRRMGKVTFAHLLDGSGRIQLYFNKQETPDYNLLKKLDIGDIIGVEGTVFTTKTGEITVRVTRWTLLVKSLRPLPDKWHGIRDKEVRYRQRYLDLIVNPEVREVFKKRAQIVRFVRRFLEDRGFLEVETPVIVPTAGGTEARPFRTYHNALGTEFELRIALELPLKRLLVGGFEKVFEIGRVFRNEGIDAQHNPEFTMLELYWAYADYNDVAQLVEDLLSSLAKAIHGSYTVPYQGREIDFTPPFKRISFVETLKERAGLDFDPLDLEQLQRWARAKHPEFADVPSYKLLDKLFEHYVEAELWNPTFVYDFPLAISPLAKKHREKPGLTERWDLFVAGLELAPAYSELNDPLDQRARFEEQARRREAGDEEAHGYDEDFLVALEHAMPPAGGLGIGIDRLTMILTDMPSIRDVILFPLLKPRRPGEAEPVSEEEA
ncbi:lysine--tRNA ligase [Marinithermus hydrothermalis]|uniref:Lysine--tRNA ligase n=1 Tax=Marinithermus hydrothermalis (strain DSM 14884 / JCM 11576 / T1) TaxID=869210 RepID=F2NP49_MARHT|nr:lysine--tRNA ligase [Marinithermus hydrothermalis]AEB11850.1 Lysyl-tRNA synthetase [Marinithermus hydrothermalis DSM 14884]